MGAPRGRFHEALLRLALGAGWLHDSNRGSWNPQTGFDFRADRDPIHEATQLIGDETAALVASIEADFVPQQASRDAHPDGRIRVEPSGGPCGVTACGLVSA